MPGKGEKGPAIGKHTHETGKKPKTGQCIDLCFHPLLLIEEPPARPKLYLARDRSVLKIPCQCGEEVIIGRVMVVDYRLGHRPELFELVKVGSQFTNLGKIPNRIKPGIGPEFLKFPGVYIAVRTEVHLLGPSLWRHRACQSAPSENF